MNNKDNKNKAIGFEINWVSNIIRRKLYFDLCEPEGKELNGMQLHVLGYLGRNCSERDVFQKDIEKAFNIRRSSATVLLNVLEEKDFIIRIPVESDKRMKKIILTEKALSLDKKIKKRIEEFEYVVEKGITNEEKEAFFKVMDKVKENLK